MMIVLNIEWLIFLLVISFVAGIIVDAVYGIKSFLNKKAANSEEQEEKQEHLQQ